MYRGARHGLKQNGKLRRIQEQESLYMQASKPTSSEANVSNHLSTVGMGICESLPSKKCKKKKKDTVNRPEQFTVDIDETELSFSIKKDMFNDEKLYKKYIRKEKHKKSKRASEGIMDYVSLLQDERTKDNQKSFQEDGISTKRMVVGVLNKEDNEFKGTDKPVKKKRKKSKAKI